VPEVAYARDLGKETVTTDIETPPLAFDRLRDTTDLLVRLEHHRVDVGTHEFQRGGETRGATTDDDHRTGRLAGYLHVLARRLIGLRVATFARALLPLNRHVHPLLTPTSNPTISSRILG